ncbi:hypothetical protein BC831DRAFT_491831 [Entophlyctis helioformis]|nr:hypothetical protein BC831DRAFT_491831 [Entophlyctis helioformis]
MYAFRIPPHRILGVRKGGGNIESGDDSWLFCPTSIVIPRRQGWAPEYYNLYIKAYNVATHGQQMVPPFLALLASTVWNHRRGYWVMKGTCQASDSAAAAGLGSSNTTRILSSNTTSPSAVAMCTRSCGRIPCSCQCSDFDQVAVHDFAREATLDFQITGNNNPSYVTYSLSHPSSSNGQCDQATNVGIASAFIFGTVLAVLAPLLVPVSVATSSALAIGANVLTSSSSGFSLICSAVSKRDFVEDWTPETLADRAGTTAQKPQLELLNRNIVRPNATLPINPFNITCTKLLEPRFTNGTSWSDVMKSLASTNDLFPGCYCVEDYKMTGCLSARADSFIRYQLAYTTQNDDDGLLLNALGNNGWNRFQNMSRTMFATNATLGYSISYGLRNESVWNKIAFNALTPSAAVRSSFAAGISLLAAVLAFVMA